MLVPYKVMRLQFFSLQAKTHPSMGMITPVRRIWVKICWFSDFGRNGHEMTIPISTPADDHQFTVNDLKSPKAKRGISSRSHPTSLEMVVEDWGIFQHWSKLTSFQVHKNIMNYYSNSSILYTEIYEYTLKSTSMFSHPRIWNTTKYEYISTAPTKKELPGPGLKPSWGVGFFWVLRKHQRCNLSMEAQWVMTRSFWWF